MEIRANYVLVGLSIIIAAVLCLIFLLWMGKRNLSQNTVRYDINFPSAVSGIGIGTDVLFLGVKVGTINDIWIDPETLSSVRVRITIADTTPIRTDTTATIELRGFTGSSVVQLRSPSTTASLLHPAPHEIPLIRAAPSSLEKITNDIPDLIASANEILGSLRLVVNEENAKKFSDILNLLDSLLNSFGSLAGHMAERGGDLQGAVNTFNAAMERIANAANRVEKLADGLDNYAGANLIQTTEAFNAMANRIGKLAEDMNPGLNRFAGDGLGEFQRLLTELRQLVTAFTHLIRRIEGDPRHFLFGNPVPEYAQ